MGATAVITSQHSINGIRLITNRVLTTLLSRCLYPETRRLPPHRQQMTSYIVLLGVWMAVGQKGYAALGGQEAVTVTRYIARQVRALVNKSYAST